MSPGIVGVGIIGAGCIGLEHLRNLLLLPTKCRIVAVADTSSKQLQLSEKTINDFLLSEKGKNYPHRDSEVLHLTSYHALMKMVAVDAVIVATPNFHHVDVLDTCCEGEPSLVSESDGRRKHILVEKPLCTTIDDCAKILMWHENDVYKAKRKVFWVGMEYRFYPSITRLIQHVHVHQTVGTPHMLSIREHRFPFLDKVGDWNRFNRFTGGTLVEKACHFYDLMRHIMRSNPTWIYASGNQAVNHLEERYNGNEIPDILDNAFTVIDFENGAKALLDLCMFAECSKYQEEISVVGDKGKVEAFAPSHGQRDASKASSASFIRVGTRNEWKQSHLPPDASKMPPIEESTVDIDPDLLDAGYHGGATFHELEAWIDAIYETEGSTTKDEGGEIATSTGDHQQEGSTEKAIDKVVDVWDGIYAVLMGIAAQRSISERRAIHFKDMLSELHGLVQKKKNQDVRDKTSSDQSVNLSSSSL